MPDACRCAAVVVQELSGDARDWSERDALVHAAMEKFRLTIRSRPDFDRGCYNLGTVFYTFAMALQGDTGADPAEGQLDHSSSPTGWTSSNCDGRCDGLARCSTARREVLLSG